MAGSGSFTSTFGDGIFYKSLFPDFFKGSTDTKFYFVQVNGSVELDYGLGFDHTLLANLNSGIVNIRNGDGGSQTTFDTTLVNGTFALYSNVGDDQIWFDGIFLGPVYAELGAGTDWIRFGFPRHIEFRNALVVDGGSGTDFLTGPPNPQDFPGYLEIINFEFGL